MHKSVIISSSGALIRTLVTTTLIQLVATATALAFTPIAPHVAHDFGVQPHLVGYQISLIYLAGAIASAVSGTLIARHGAVRVEQAAMAACALGLLGLATANLWVAVVATLLIGVGYGLQNPASSQILGRQTPAHRRNMIFSIKQAGVPLGAVVASLGMPLLDGAVGWRVALVGAVILPLALMVHLGSHRAEEAHEKPDSAPFISGFLREQRLVWGRPPLRILSLLGLLYSSAQLSLSAFGVLLLLEGHRWTLLGAAAIAAGAQICGAVGRIAWGVLADRTGSGFLILAIIGFGSGASMIALAWLPVMPGLAQIAVMCALGFCLSGWNGVAMAEMTRHCDPADTGRVIGGTLVYTFIGVMIGPSSFATIYGHVGHYGMTFAIASSVMLAGGIAALATGQSRAPPRP